MGRPAFLTFKKPFAKETVDNYPGVLVPLAQAKRHQTVIAKYASQSSDSSEKGSISVKKASIDAEPTVSSTVGASNYDAYTVQGIEWEVDNDTDAGSHDTVYDRELDHEPYSEQL